MVDFETGVKAEARVCRTFGFSYIDAEAKNEREITVVELLYLPFNRYPKAGVLHRAS